LILTLDNSTLTLLINPDARPPDDPKTREPLKYAKERVEGLILSLGSSDRLIIPTPVLAEVLVAAEDGAPEILNQMQTLARIQVAPFGQRAAVELAAMTRDALKLGTKKGSSTEPWQKVKFDRQIIAIARVSGSDTIYSDDVKLCEFARSVGVSTQSTWDLPLPDREPNLLDKLNDLGE
jgi:predicted nucleic acid-binding protein